MDFDLWQLESIAEFLEEPLRSALLNISRRLEDLEVGQRTTASLTKDSPSDAPPSLSLPERPMLRRSPLGNGEESTAAGNLKSQPWGHPITTAGPAEQSSGCVHQWRSQNLWRWDMRLGNPMRIFLSCSLCPASMWFELTPVRDATPAMAGQ